MEVFQELRHQQVSDLILATSKASHSLKRGFKSSLEGGFCSMQIKHNVLVGLSF